MRKRRTRRGWPTLVCQSPDHCSLHAILHEPHERAEQPAPVGEPPCALAEAFSEEAKLGEGGDVVCNGIDEREEERGRGVQEEREESGAERLMFCFG